MVYGQITPTALNTATNDNNIDGLLWYKRWASNRITFSFTDDFKNDYEDELGYLFSTTHEATFEMFNATQQAVARAWMEMYENVANLDLVELTSANDRNATIRMGRSQAVLNGAFTQVPPGNEGIDNIGDGDIWFGVTFDNPLLGTGDYLLYGHEIGHALGLSHGHEPFGVREVAMNSNRDSMEFSIMTYRSYIGGPTRGTNESGGFAQSLMMYDIAAIQHMYGANFNYNAGNTTYTFSPTTGEMSINGVGQGRPLVRNNIFRTIWDGNGLDTYDFSNYTTKLRINLAPGGWSDLDVGGNSQRARLNANGNEYARGHIFNALQYDGDTRSLIERAKGGSNNDQILGNDARNYLYGNSGNDGLYGYGGIDNLYGHAGNDSLYGHDDNDFLYGWTGNDKLYGGAGIDSLYGHWEDDHLDGGSGNDRLWGGSDNDTLIGGADSDELSGSAGRDILIGVNPYAQTGSSEIDELIGGSGRDRFVLGVGAPGSATWIGGASPRVFYDDNVNVSVGRSSYAHIKDFTIGEDDIQLRGSRNDYRLSDYQVNGRLGTGIFYNRGQITSELIGFVEGVTQGTSPDQLNLSSPLGSQFTWV
ncbi:MAG: M10 family metallopeptidase C-terminal domain-containing protein [Cyanobacteria bacterium P01_A01_bin.123]